MGCRRRGLRVPGRAWELRHRDGGAQRHRAWPAVPSTSVALRLRAAPRSLQLPSCSSAPHPNMPESLPLRRPAPGPCPQSPVTVKLPGHARPRPHHPVQPHLLGPFPAADTTCERPLRGRDPHAALPLLPASRCAKEEPCYSRQHCPAPRAASDHGQRSPSSAPVSPTPACVSPSVRLTKNERPS